MTPCNYSPAALEGLTRAVRQPDSCRWRPLPCDQEALAAGLTILQEDQTKPTALGVLVFDEIALAAGYKFRGSAPYQRRLLKALREYAGLSPDPLVTGEALCGSLCACPLCGDVRRVEILRGRTLGWWQYQIENITRERCEADVETAMDIEYQVRRVQ